MTTDAFQRRDMSREEFQRICDFEAHLTIGLPVIARWINRRAQPRQVFAARGTITQIEARSVLVTLTQEVRVSPDVVQYARGQSIKLPRINTVLWSRWFRIEPSQGDHEQALHTLQEGTRQPRQRSELSKE
jgi:hypothetical protein